MHETLSRTSRQDPAEWHRRGMRSPAELDRMVAFRMHVVHTPAPVEPDATYESFFTAG